jgi:cyclophilin family peptidyl-prolyl cis-trans isomerase
MRDLPLLRRNGRAAAARLLPWLAAAGLAMGAAAQATATEPASSLQPRVRIETSAGAFVIELDTVRAPLTAESFLRYVRDGFYEGLLMHRVVQNFVVQGGGYTPDYQPRTTRAAIVNESGNGLSNVRGTVGMARGETPHSATSQFYVNVKDNPGLNPLPTRWGYPVFGKVVEGMEVVDAMAYVPTGERAGFADTPLEPIVIQRAVVVGEDEAPPAAASPAAETPEETPPEAPSEASQGESGGTPESQQEGAEAAREAEEPAASAPPEGGAAESRS